MLNSTLCLQYKEKSDIILHIPAKEIISQHLFQTAGHATLIVLCGM